MSGKLQLSVADISRYLTDIGGNEQDKDICEVLGNADVAGRTWLPLVVMRSLYDTHFRPFPAGQHNFQLALV